MHNWDFIIRGFAGSKQQNGIPYGALLVETTHKGEASVYVTIEAWQARMKRGEVSHAELIDFRPGGKLTNLRVLADTRILWSWCLIAL